VHAETTGENLFGERYTTISDTYYTYGGMENVSSPAGWNGHAQFQMQVFGVLTGAHTDSTTTGYDIWGASYTTVSSTDYVNN